MGEGEGEGKGKCAFGGHVWGETLEGSGREVVIV